MVFIPNEDIRSSLTEFELKLCEHFKRLEIRGKRGRKVPILITQDVENARRLIAKLRDGVGVNPNNKYLFSIPSMGSLQYLQGNDALRKHVRLCNLSCPVATRRRNSVSTLRPLVNY